MITLKTKTEKFELTDVQVFDTKIFSEGKNWRIHVGSVANRKFSFLFEPSEEDNLYFPIHFVTPEYFRALANSFRSLIIQTLNHCGKEAEINVETLFHKMIGGYRKNFYDPNGNQWNEAMQAFKGRKI